MQEGNSIIGAASWKPALRTEASWMIHSSWQNGNSKINVLPSGELSNR